MKKLINAPDDVVAESLVGVAAAHPELRVDHEHRVIFRADGPVPGQVGLVSGGGSGHEPLHAGFVGLGMLDAAACGARILSDRIDGLEETFSGLVLPFDNEHELARLVQPPYDSFPDNAARREIATRIIAEHSFDKRAETLIDDAVRALLARR